MSDRQLSREDVQRLAQQGKHDEIEKARVEGRLARILGVPEDDVALVDRATYTTEPLSREDLHRLNQLGKHDLVLEAFRDGRTNNQEK
jgi:hypothetical protein